MLIIFDLDDTLIDTSGCTIPIKLREALRVMIEAGLKVDSFEETLNLFKKVDSTSPDGEESLRRFLKEINADPSLFEIAVKEYYNPVPVDTVIKTLEGAKEVLTELKKENTLAIVSKGKQELQYQKMKKANISKDLFSKIIITEEYNKNLQYQEVLKELGFTTDETIVVGDKFGGDLLPAKKLGIKTVQMMWGRALKFPEEGADYKIKKLEELKDIIKELKS